MLTRGVRCFLVADVRYTVRYPSGAVEYRYGENVPKRGDRIGRNGDEGFVTSVECDEHGETRVAVGTRAAATVTWADAVGSVSPDDPRERIMEAAYDLFSRRGVRAVSMDELLEAAEVSEATLETHFATKDDVVLAFLHRREHRWTLGFVEAEARRRGATPRERLLAIFDVFDEWFQRDDFEGCSFINVLVEVGDFDDPLARASAQHLETIRSVVRTMGEEAGVPDPAGFAHSWHILMKGSIIAAGEGDRDAAKRAKAMAESLLDRSLASA